MKIKGSTFLITGGASGLGEGTALKLVKEGANVVLLDVNKEAGKAVANKLGSNALFIATDISSPEDVQQAVNTAVKKFGSINGAINCAGVAAGERIISRKGDPHRLSSFSRVMHINVIGSFNVLRIVAAQIAKQNKNQKEGQITQDQGVIINTASIAAFEGQIGQAAYSASKGAMVSLTLPAARELGRHGIRVIAVAPGVFETPMMAQLPDRVRKSLERQTPFPPRFGSPEEYADLVVHIVQNSMINGTTFRLDGAMRMSAL